VYHTFVLGKLWQGTAFLQNLTDLQCTWGSKMLRWFLENTRASVRHHNTFYIRTTTVVLSLTMGVRRKFSWGGNADISLILFRLLTMQRKWTYTKRLTLSTPQRKCPVLRQQLQTVFFLWENFAPSQVFWRCFTDPIRVQGKYLAFKIPLKFIKGNIWGAKHLWVI